MAATGYPVRVDAQLDPQLSRWLWLVKWLLALPHYVLLAFLWVGFVVTTIIAFFAILFTGRYPHALFVFNVGVLRWTWRVNYYAYDALGTDRYPPFTLAEVPDYPAHLAVDYPERLSRGLVLVKWWLLVLPHYIIVGILIGGASAAASSTDGDRWYWGGGLLSLLVVVAAIVLLFTGRYPRGIFDLVMGLNRWVLRVAGYASLMTDQYPPFRLDQGGADPTQPPGGVPPGHPPGFVPTPEHAPTRHRSPWTLGRVIALVLGSLLVLSGMGFGLGAAGLAVLDGTQRDSDDFWTTDPRAVSTEGYALVSDPMRIDDVGSVVEQFLGDARVTASDTEPLFLGVAPADDVASYLDGVAHTTVLRLDPGDVELEDVDGTATPAEPADLDIWVASTSGSGEQQITWQLEEGDWTVVLMRPDAAPEVAADVSVGATVPGVEVIIAVMGVIALVLIALGFVVVVLAAASVHREHPEPRVPTPVA